MTEKYRGADWMERNRQFAKDKDKPMSDLGKKVADLLGQVYRGIYHIQKEACRVEWSNPHQIAITLYDGHGLSTYDGNELTELVLLCHLMNVRVDITAAAYRYLRLTFCDVKHPGFFRDNHPCLDEAIKRAQELLPYEYATGDQLDRAAKALAEP